MTDSTAVEIIPGSRFRPVTWFLNNARWYGAEWWITLSGGVLLLVLILMTIFADRLAPYDPIKFVGAPFTRPRAQQSVIVLQDDAESISGSMSAVESLQGRNVGLVTNSQAARELEKLGIQYAQYSAIRLAIQALKNGEIDTLVTDAKDPKYAEQVREQGVQVQTVGEPFGTSFLMGTDNYGRDVYSRILYGARTVMGIAILAAALSAAVGVPLGLVSGLLGGRLDRVLSLIMDSLYAFPGLILAIVMAALLGPGVLNVAVAIAVIYVPVYFRLVRGKVLSAKEELYVEAARSLGASVATILGLYIFPNVIPSIVVIFSVNVADSILTEAGLAFLGLGLPPPTPDWGFDLSAGKRFVPSGSWWIITFPGLMIALLTLGFSLLGEGLNEILNPRLTET